jgi:hypothetical protein
MQHAAATHFAASQASQSKHARRSAACWMAAARHCGAAARQPCALRRTPAAKLTAL